MSKLNNLIGQKFSLLTVIERDFEYPNKNDTYWIVKCDCGKSKSVSRRNLLDGSTKSCGCMTLVWRGEARRLRDQRKYKPHIATAKRIYSANVKSGGYSDGNLTFDQFLKLSQLPCSYCGALPSNKRNKFENEKNRGRAVSQKSVEQGTFVYNGLDRIDSTKPHDYDNVVPCCKWCNYAKLNRTSAEFKEWVKRLYEHLFEQKENGFQVNLEAV